MSYRDKVWQMKFSKEEEKALIAQRDLIIKWVMENIVPKIPKGECLRVDFGDSVKDPKTWERTTEYHFGAFGTKHHFWGDLDEKTMGFVGWGEWFGNLMHAFEDITHPAYIFPVVDNWREIKQMMLDEVAKLEKSHSSIANFTI